MLKRLHSDDTAWFKGRAKPTKIWMDTTAQPALALRK